MALTDSQKEEIRRLARAGAWPWMNLYVERMIEFEREVAAGASEDQAFAAALQKIPTLFPGSS